MSSINSIGLATGMSSFAGGTAALSSAKTQKESGEFDALIQSLNAKKDSNNSTLSSSQIQSSRLNGDYTSGFEGAFTSEADKTAALSGAAANSGAGAYGNVTIDKTSKLYEQALELESYFMKIMLNSMKATLSSNTIYGEKSYATEMYEDMLYDELATQMTKSSGLGIADQIYLELV